MATVRELITNLGFEVDDSQLKEFNKSVDTVKGTLAALGTAAVAGAAALFGVAKSVADTGDEIAKTAPTVGLSAKALQEYRYAADLAGVSNTEFTSSMQIFNRTIGQAQNGMGTTAKTLESLGVKIKNANGTARSNEEIIKDLTFAYQNLPNDARKAALTQELFGRAGIKMAGFLSQGTEEIENMRREANRLGIVLSDDTLKASEEFGDSLTRFWKVIEGIKFSIGAELIPIITELIDEFRDFILANRQLITMNLKKFIAGLVEFLKIMRTVLTSVANAFISISKAVGGTENALKLIVGTFLAIKALNFAKALFVIISNFKILAAVITGVISPIMAIPVAIGAVLAGLYYFREEVFAVFQFILNRIKNLPIAFEAFKTLIVTIFSDLKGLGSDFLAVFLDGIYKIGETIMSVIGGAIEKVRGALGTVFDGIKSATGAVSSVASGARERLGSAASSVGSFFGFGGGADSTARAPSQISSDVVNSSQMSTQNNRNVNVSSDITVNVPPGTSETQAEFLRNAAREVFKEEYENELQNALYDNPTYE